ncbi:hypothetical protein E2C01_060277 [Portunus trituberculatus]|uniref:Uncharacterized protein n=1 Tax=Portunus trituberculatus TaxID=210409 RepID=A0A5B7H4T2_PORTR|nr:hypothetical protein [Portunus trituberculatus]
MADYIMLDRTSVCHSSLPPSFPPLPCRLSSPSLYLCFSSLLATSRPPGRNRQHRLTCMFLLLFLSGFRSTPDESPAAASHPSRRCRSATKLSLYGTRRPSPPHLVAPSRHSPQKTGH